MSSSAEQPDDPADTAAAPLRLVSPPYEEVLGFLGRAPERNLLLLAALEYDPIEMIWGLRRGSALTALAMVCEPEGPFSNQRAAVLLDAQDAPALAELLARGDWPARPRWIAHRPELLPLVEQFCGARRQPGEGVYQYILARAPERPQAAPVRQLALEDADTLALAPCSLSPVALRNWIKRGWRVFGAVADGVLLGHALAAYPVGQTEEVAAVFTAPTARRQGIASTVVAAAAADIAARGHRATYVCRKTNLASQRVAEGLGFRLLVETWELSP